MKSLTLIVNKNDEIIGLGTREEIFAQKTWYRVSGLRINNSKGEILLSQRSFDKKQAPGKRGAAVAGTNEEGETYISNIIKEAKEEIGIDITEDMLILGPKRTNSGEHNHFTQRFFLTIDKPIEEFTPEKDSVIALKWVPKEDFIRELFKSPDNFTPNAIKTAQAFGLI